MRVLSRVAPAAAAWLLWGNIVLDTLRSHLQPSTHPWEARGVYYFPMVRLRKLRLRQKGNFLPVLMRYN